MLVVGLTGNIAAGKSLVAARFRTHGATVVDADVLAREAVAPGSECLTRIVGRWGKSVLSPDGSLDRAALRAVVFADPIERLALEHIVHPEVNRLREAHRIAAREAGEQMLICDIPLLFEAHLVDSVDRVVLVDAPEELRLARLTTQRGLSEVDAESMMLAQWPSGAKRTRAHYIIENIGTVAELESRADEVYNELQAESAFAA